MNEFDPYRWVFQACSAGVDPIVLRYSDGSGRALYCNAFNVDRELEPPMGVYLTGERQTAILNLLEAMGRVADVPPPSKPLSQLSNS